jgi:sterol desaturase/sphingolipid hydroxylase (fatty acid hydroxylase superfamily)
MNAIAALPAILVASAPIWIFPLAFMTALELLLPGERQPIGGRLAGLLFWALWLPCSTVIYTLFRAFWSWLGIEPLVVLPLTMTWLGPLAVVAAPLASAFVYDFFFYWFHRAQHRWLWRFHAVHHSIRELSAVNAFHHLSEPIFQTLFLLVPAALVASQAGAVVPWMIVVLHLHGSFIHSSTSLHLGPLRALLCDNRFHRIHHSLEERHFDTNFGACTTLWDRLFGTAHFPAPGEWPATGISGVRPPRTLREWLSLPWRAPSEEPATVEPRGHRASA